MRIVLCLFLSATSFSSFTQEIERPDVSENKLKLEFEPGLFFNNGRSLGALYTVTPDNNFAVGLYLLATDIPETIHQNIFNNVVPNTKIRVLQEYAFTFRYRFNVFKKYESNPYLGLILGWEEIKFTNATLPDLNFTTFLVTPHVGYELYLYKRMLFLNTQIRSVFYVGDEKSDVTRTEEIKGFTIIPSISLGLRI